MYFMLECYGPTDQERQAIDKIPVGFHWNHGVPFNPAPSKPLEVTLDGDGILVPMFNRGILLFRDDLLEAVQQAGVDNIECYEAELLDPSNGNRYKNYKAVNIIGIVSAVDLGKSVYSMPSGIPMIDTDFDSVSIDIGRAHGLLMFRLAECVSSIVIHEKVKVAIENTNIPYMNFIQPEDWFG